MNESEKKNYLFIDTSAWIGWYFERDIHHKKARGIVRDIKAGRLQFAGLFTSDYILDELITYAIYHYGHRDAMRVVDEIYSSTSVEKLFVDKQTFENALIEIKKWERYKISFTDCTTAILMRKRGISHIFCFDTDFDTMGFRTIPRPRKASVL